MASTEDGPSGRQSQSRPPVLPSEWTLVYCRGRRARSTHLFTVSTRMTTSTGLYNTSSAPAAKRVGHEGTVDGAGHHHDRHVVPVIERANPRDQRDPTHVVQSVAHKDGIVRGAPPSVWAACWPPRQVVTVHPSRAKR